MSRMSLPARARAGAGRFTSRLLIGPIRAGRLRDTGWPIGLRTIVLSSTVAFGLAVLLVVASPLLRAVLPLSLSNGAAALSLPRVLLPLFFALVVLSAALLQTAAMHMRWVAAAPITALSCLLLLYLGGMDQGEALDFTLVTPGKVVSLVASIGLVVLLVVRRRRPFSWVEFAIVLALIGGTTVVSLWRAAAQTLPFGIDFGPPTASILMGALGSLAAPAALAAGVAVAEFAIAAAFAIVATVRERSPAAAASPTGRGRPVLRWAFGILAVWLTVETALRYATGSPAAAPPEELVGTGILLGLLVAGVALLWLARRRGRPVTPEETLGGVGGIVLPVAAAVTALLIPVTVVLLAAQVFMTWGGGATPAALASAAVTVLSSTAVTLAIRTLVAAGLVVLAIVLAHRGRRGVPELLLAFGLVIGASSVPALLGLEGTWSSEAASVLLAAGSILLGIVLAVRRRLGSAELAALSVALLLAEAAAWREVLANPLSALLGASVIAFVLLGFLWGFVTGADTTHEGSVSYPVPARVLLFLANNLFGVTVLAFAALARDLDAVIDLDQFAGVGDAVLGTALIAVLAVVLWAGAVAGQVRAPAAEPSGPPAPEASATAPVNAS
ncbi:hypothetical protein [Naasia sp. SYSU D00948]|uniref:hypothetical protein n=1 Tax=Naasia sp. SYSU D00948 TaxID=2817379 RepID=UPI001B30B40D|nr:hypothetical protein [Naasia sp. SYSU D00948]